MDKTLHILQKSTDGVPTGISLDMSLNMDEGEDFTEQQIVGLPDKIPLVKPYFKKKQRKLDAKCLHRALEDPLLTTLLSTDTLVSGDGVFVPRNQPGRTPGNLCAAAVVKQNCMGQVCLKDSGAADDATAGAGVPGLMTRDGDVEIADTTAELEETERRGERPKIHRSNPRQPLLSGKTWPQGGWEHSDNNVPQQGYTSHSCTQGFSPGVRHQKQ
ncbi:hypothetical protein E3U43_011981 [Larimichthys crocea]|uniref:Uncharacterized protein n=1 Tax=Larimichthys crocea TaxID=215358 RepID=A0ACD3QL99_LARCR|nr:hypothetical protein E3U43_011981 [Larimichthys crocea]